MRLRFAVFVSLLASSLLVSTMTFPQEPGADWHHEHASTSAARRELRATTITSGTAGVLPYGRPAGNGDAPSRRDS